MNPYWIVTKKLLKYSIHSFMNKKLHKYTWGILATLCMLFQGCSLPANTVAEEFQPIENNTWKWADSKSFTFTIDDSTHYYNLSIGLRIQGTFAYSNIWLISQIQETTPTSKPSSNRYCGSNWALAW